MKAALQHFGSIEKIFYIHFRNVIGSVPKFRECFIDEGDVDTLSILVALKKMNFTGFLIDDHVPQVVNDTEWGHRSRAYATGYISALIRAAKQLG